MADVKIDISADGSAAQKEIKKIENSFEDLRNKLAKIAAFIGVGLLAKKSISLAAEFESNVNKLNNALALAGRFSESASKSFQNLASEIQRTTTFGDDEVLQIAALATNFARSNEQAEKLTRASIELSAVTGRDLRSSVEALGRTLTGSGTALRQIGISTKQFTSEQLKAGAAIDFVLKRFGGASVGLVNSFDGAIIQLGNNFEDFLKSLGKFITDSPVIREIIKSLSQLFSSLSNSLGDLSKKDFLGNLIKQIVDFSAMIGPLVLGPIEVVVRTVNAVFDSIVTGFQAVLTTIVSLASKITNVFAPNSNFAKTLSTFAESSQLTLVDFANKTNESISNMLSRDVTEQITKNLESFQSRIESVRSTAQNFKNNIQTTFSVLPITFSSIAEAWKQESQKMIVTAESVAQAFRNTFISGISNAFSSFGRAIATGKNAFNEFGKSIFNILGGLAIQLGQFFILVGTGMTATGPLLGLSGGAAIAAGIGLTVLGGLLQGLGGGGETASPVSTPNAGPGVGGPETPEAPKVEGKTTAVTINVEGTVLNPREVGMQIAQILNDTFDANDTRVIARA